MLRQSTTLWTIDGFPADAVEPADSFEAELVQFIELSGQALISTVMQIGTQQRAFVRLAGCGTCEHGRCTPGCRVRLFTRVVKSGWRGTSLRHIEQGTDRGLVERPYKRVYIGTPMYNALPLDGSLLHEWRDARLTLFWKHGHMPVPQQKSVVAHVPALFGKRVIAGAVLLLGEGGPDDPQVIFGAKNWRFRSVPPAKQPALWWYGRSTIHRPLVGLGAPSSLTPHLLVPHSRDAEANPIPDIPKHQLALDEAVVAHGHATTIARELHSLEARVEFLDLHPDTWTATLAAIHPAGMDHFLRDLQADHPALFVKNAKSMVVGLRNTASMAPGMLPPVLKLGTLKDGLTRYRPIGRTHHLIVSGAELAGVLAGLVAPLVDGRSDVRLGILDTADGFIARELSGIPRRLPTVRADDEQELLGVLGSVSALGVPVMVIVYVTDADQCRRAVIPLLRASAYLNLSIVMATPNEDVLPELIRNRVPILRIDQRLAHWESPFGIYYEWGQKTPLRLPFRDPKAPWTLPDASHIPVIVDTDEFWTTPDHLMETLIPGYAEQPEAELAAKRARLDAEANTNTAFESTQTEQSPDATSLADEQPPAQETPVEPSRNPIRWDKDLSVTVDDELIGHVLQRINAREDVNTISIKEIKDIFELPHKGMATQVLQALKDAKIIVDEPRQGHYTYLSVSQAIADGKFADGPWAAETCSTDVSDACEPESSAAVPAPDADTPEPATAAAPAPDASEPESSTPVTTAPETSDAPAPSDDHPTGQPSDDDLFTVTEDTVAVVTDGAGLWQVTGVQDDSTTITDSTQDLVVQDDSTTITDSTQDLTDTEANDLPEFGFEREDVLAPDDGNTDAETPDVDDVEAGTIAAPVHGETAQ